MMFPTYISLHLLPTQEMSEIGVVMYSKAGWGTYNYLLRRLRHINHDG